MRIARSMLLLVVGLASMPASAIPITYDFVGAPITSVPSDFPPGITHFHGFFTVDDLPANVADYSAPLIDWMFSDGLTTATPLGDVTTWSEFTTDALGQLTSVRIGFTPNAPLGDLPVGSSTGMELRQNLLVDWIQDNTISYCWNFDHDGDLCNFGHFYPVGPVTVTARTVPEPGMLSLLCLGMTGLWLARRQRDARPAS